MRRGRHSGAITTYRTAPRLPSFCEIMSNPSSSSTLLLLSESDVSRILEDLLLGEIVRCSYLSAVTSQLKQCSSGFIQLACIGRALYAFSHQNAAINGPTMETPPIQSPLRISIRTPAHDVLFMPSRLGRQAFRRMHIYSISLTRFPYVVRVLRLSR